MPQDEKKLGEAVGKEMGKYERKPVVKDLGTVKILKHEFRKKKLGLKVNKPEKYLAMTLTRKN